MLFLVDAKLVLLQPSTDDDQSLKYDMRVIANNVEYFDLMRDQAPLLSTQDRSFPDSPLNESPVTEAGIDRGLRDSLWFFDGNHIQCWLEVDDLLESASTENDRELPQAVTISIDFYPSSVILNKGVILGVDADLVQRRDVNFAMFRLGVRVSTMTLRSTCQLSRFQTELFLPPILRRYLSLFDSSAAFSLSHRYDSLPYFPHVLEILLHTVLDDEVDSPPAATDALLPSVLSFLSYFPSYLDILVQCTRKTEVRSWRTLFAHLPPPQTLFEASVEKGMLKTAGGYLLVLHTLEEAESGSEQCVRLLQKAKERGDWDLCKELARFLMALDESGEELRKAVQRMDLHSSPSSLSPSAASSASASSAAVARSAQHEGVPKPEYSIRLKIPRPNGAGKRLGPDAAQNKEQSASPSSSASGSAAPG